MAPSAIRMKDKSLIGDVMMRLAFGTPREMTQADFVKVKDQFLFGARVAKEAGFSGVQLHCSHGYLLSSLLSTRTNQRRDQFSGSTENRMRFLLDLIDAIRFEHPAPFCLAVKLNAADYISGGLTEAEALEHVRILARHGGIDVIEISGGNYESPTFANPREAFFASFAGQCREAVASLPQIHRVPLILVTGGFRERSSCRNAIQNGAADLIGIGRAACIVPDLAKVILDNNISDKDARCPPYQPRGIDTLKCLSPVQIVGASFSTFWHTMQMRRLANGKQADLQKGLLPGYAVEFAGHARTLLSSVFLLACILVVVSS